MMLRHNNDKPNPGNTGILLQIVWCASGSHDFIGSSAAVNKFLLLSKTRKTSAWK
jgi:hypothetical protein